MSLLNDVRKSITDAADTIVEKGQQLSELARLQIAMKKLQVDRAKRLHELGSRAYALYQVEKLLAKNPLPRDIHEMCEPIEEIDRQMEDTQRQMEEVHAATQEGIGATHTVEAVVSNGHTPEPVAETFVAQVTVPVGPPTVPVATSAAAIDAGELLKRIESLELQLKQSRKPEETPQASTADAEVGNTVGGASTSGCAEGGSGEGVSSDGGSGEDSNL